MPFSPDEVAEWLARMRRFLNPARRRAAGDHRRGQDRRIVLLAALNENGRLVRRPRHAGRRQVGRDVGRPNVAASSRPIPQQLPRRRPTKLFLRCGAMVRYYGEKQSVLHALDAAQHEAGGKLSSPTPRKDRAAPEAAERSRGRQRHREGAPLAVLGRSIVWGAGAPILPGATQSPSMLRTLERWALFPSHRLFTCRIEGDGGRSGRAITMPSDARTARSALCISNGVVYITSL